MTFRLRIPGRDGASVQIVAIPAIPLLSMPRDSGIAELADVTASADRINIRRIARAAQLGYGKHGDVLAKLLDVRDHGLDDRRLCIECIYAGQNFHCTKKEGFLLDLLQRCRSFKDDFSSGDRERDRSSDVIDTKPTRLTET